MANQRIEMEALLVEIDNPNFIPCPKISLSIDAKKLGNCGICQESQLLLRSGKRAFDDHTLAILPCGHVAGFDCLRNWFSFNKSCPFCRTPLEYQLCTHSSRLIRPLTRENLLNTPDTLPVGGALPAQCSTCSIATNASVNKYLLDAMLEKFKDLRTEYHAETDTRKKLEVKLQILTCKKRIDKAIDELAAYPTLARTRWRPPGGPSSAPFTIRHIFSIPVLPLYFEGAGAQYLVSYTDVSTILQIFQSSTVGRRLSSPPTNTMNRPVATRVLENLNKYRPVVNDLQWNHPEFKGTIFLVGLALNGLAKYYGLFILDQPGKLINTARIEDDYSRNVTLIGREIKTWAKNPNLTLKGKMVLDQLYLVLERCLRDALELYTASERELISEGVKIYMSASDGYGEYERAKASLWKFQNEFHLHQIDHRRGSDRAIIYTQPGFSGPPAGFGNVDFTTQRWQEPDDDSIGILTQDEQTQLKNFISRPEIQKLLPSELRNPNIPLPPSEEDDDDDTGAPGPSNIIYVRGPKRPFQHKKGILKDHLYGAVRDTPRKTVRFGKYDGTPLSWDSVHDRRSPPLSYDDTTDTPPESPPSVPPSVPPIPPPIIPSSPPPIVPVHSPPRVIPLSFGNIIVSIDTPPSPAVAATKEASNPRENPPGFVAVVEGPTAPNTPISINSTSSTSSTSSSLLPSVGSPRFTPPSSFTDNVAESLTSSSSSETTESEKRESSLLARTEKEVQGEVALSIRAYLGRRHGEYGMALPADPDECKDVDEDKDIPPWDDDVPPWEDAWEDKPHDDEACAAHRQLGGWSARRMERDVARTMLPHWAGVAKAKREERQEGHTRLRAILKWAEREGRVPLSPSSIRASTRLRRSIFTPLRQPDLPPPPPVMRVRRGSAATAPGAYREEALANLEKLRPRLELTLLAFLFNEDALRLFGGLVGEQPRPSDLGRMDKVLRELEVYTAVCAHRRGLIVGHLKRTRSFPTSVPAQFGDLRASLQDAEEDVLSSWRRCFEYVAERSRYVVTYPGNKRRRREFAGRFGPRDRERLEYLSGVEEEAGVLWHELEEAEGWKGWCEGVMDEWTAGWRPARVEGDMLYVGEDAQADVRRYQREINEKRVAIGLVTVRRPRDEVYERQQEHIRGLDGLWKVMT